MAQKNLVTIFCRKLEVLLILKLNIQHSAGPAGFPCEQSGCIGGFDVSYNGLKIAEKKTRSKLLHTDCFLMRDGQVIL